MPMQLEIVTAERVVLSEEVDALYAPTKAGRVGILPRHSALLTILDVGEMDIVKGNERTPYAIAGGFMEVLNNRVTILADSVERADEIDEVRAEQARAAAEEALRNRESNIDLAQAEGELRRAMNRLRISQMKNIRRS